MLKRTCFRCGLRKCISEFDYSSTINRGGRVFRQCVECSNKEVRYKVEEKGEFTVYDKPRWCVPEQFMKNIRRWGDE